ncbi:MAG: hypothetical protein ACR2M3_07305 [Thermomicrobiales bacterium]
MNGRDPEATITLVIEALQWANRRGMLLTGWGGMGTATLADDIVQIDLDEQYPRVEDGCEEGQEQPDRVEG